MILKWNFCAKLILLAAVTQATNLHAADLTYQWNFGDGNESTEASPKHEYDTPDFYTVTLKAYVNQDLSYSKQYEVDAVTPAIKSLTVQIPERVEQNEETLLSVNLTSDYDLSLDYTWTLPDNKVISGENSTVKFENSGENRVALNAYFKERLVSEQVIKINVLAKDDTTPTTPPTKEESGSGGSLFWLSFIALLVTRLKASKL
ncbi:PKD domain-containing protein [Pseudoalteromonas sp. SMS1]|uniref:PKD domain-containing protein n=1 Tax=Pseudoalteromonas sp. SMS1 TaxID=2908894 RepID=UPI001F357711|nr:PKD domain-containing protein [Pseudoalteromonas sp. SMS1]MCF2858070.1 PKD domain-containing protein [Pseudoalteromonas sp. SMS1]